jgi:hypothetical protein
MWCPICKSVLKAGVLCAHLLVAAVAGDGDTFHRVDWAPQMVEAPAAPSGSLPPPIQGYDVSADVAIRASWARRWEAFRVALNAQATGSPLVLLHSPPATG